MRLRAGMMPGGRLGRTNDRRATIVDVDEIAAAARRVAAQCRELQDARAVTGVAPGAYDDMRAPEYHDAALAIRRSTTPNSYLQDVGQACGDIAGLMTARAEQDPSCDDPRWWLLRDFLAERSERWGPYEFVIADNRRLELLETPTPTVTRFDLLAALVTPEAVAVLAEAANWCREQVTT